MRYANRPQRDDNVNRNLNAILDPHDGSFTASNNLLPKTPKMLFGLCNRMAATIRENPDIFRHFDQREQVITYDISRKLKQDAPENSRNYEHYDYTITLNVGKNKIANIGPFTYTEENGERHQRGIPDPDNPEVAKDHIVLQRIDCKIHGARLDVAGSLPVELQQLVQGAFRAGMDYANDTMANAHFRFAVPPSIDKQCNFYAVEGGVRLDSRTVEGHENILKNYDKYCEAVKSSIMEDAWKQQQIQQVAKKDQTANVQVGTCTVKIPKKQFEKLDMETGHEIQNRDKHSFSDQLTAYGLQFGNWLSGIARKPLTITSTLNDVINNAASFAAVQSARNALKQFVELPGTVVNAIGDMMIKAGANLKSTAEPSSPLQPEVPLEEVKSDAQTVFAVRHGASAKSAAADMQEKHGIVHVRTQDTALDDRTSQRENLEHVPSYSM